MNYLKIKPVGYWNGDKKVSNIYDQPFRGKLESQKVIAYLSLSSWDSALQIARFSRLLKKAKQFLRECSSSCIWSYQNQQINSFLRYLHWFVFQEHCIIKLDPYHSAMKLPTAREDGKTASSIK